MGRTLEPRDKQRDRNQRGDELVLRRRRTVEQRNHGTL